MKKWIYIGIGVLIVILVACISIYYGAISEQEKNVSLAIEKSKQAGIKNVENVSYYNGSIAYQIVFGKNQRDQKVIVWIPEEISNKNPIIIKDAKSGISKEKARDIVLIKENPKKFKEFRIGMEKNRALWEITYLDSKNRLTYYYIDFETGDFIKRYSLKKGIF